MFSVYTKLAKINFENFVMSSVGMFTLTVQMGNRHNPNLELSPLW
jgi:hypothetical protein